MCDEISYQESCLGILGSVICWVAAPACSLDVEKVKRNLRGRHTRNRRNLDLTYVLPEGIKPDPSFKNYWRLLQRRRGCWEMVFFRVLSSINLFLPFNFSAINFTDADLLGDWFRMKRMRGENGREFCSRFTFCV